LVYGPPYEESKLEFLEELNYVLGRWQGGTLIGAILTLLETKERKAMESLILDMYMLLMT
jgi:hypothetical protein